LENLNVALFEMINAPADPGVLVPLFAKVLAI